MASKDFLVRAASGQLGVRSGVGGSKPKTKQQILEHNRQYSTLMDSDVHSTLHFASVDAFEQWHSALSGKEKERYADWKAEELANGNVVVYRDLNKDGKYEADTDMLVAVNGQRLGKSHAATRREFADYKAKNPDAEYSKYKRAGGGGGLSGFNMVAKVVGAVCKANGIKFKDAASYSMVSANIYAPIRDNLISQFRKAPFNVPVQMSATKQGLDLSLAKMAKSPIFKCGVLDSLNKSEIAVMIRNTIDGRGPSGIRESDQLPNLLRDFDNTSKAIIIETAQTYGINANSLFKGIGADVVVVPEHVAREGIRMPREGVSLREGQRAATPRRQFPAQVAPRTSSRLESLNLPNTNDL